MSLFTLAMAGYTERARARSRRKGACGDVSCRPCAPDSHSMQLPATGAALNLPVPSQQPDPLPRRTHTPSCPPSQRHSQDNCCRRRRPVPPCDMMMLFIGTHSVTTTLNVHSRSRSFVIAIDLRGLAPSMRLFRRPNTNSMKK